MIRYTIIKELNPDEVKASTAGTMNFLVFTFSAFLGPIFGLALQRLSDGAPLTLTTFQEADVIWVGAIVRSLILTFLLRETVAAVRSATTRRLAR
jgi:ABC-type phosphate/phosphonate transport system permease subunit